MTDSLKFDRCRMDAIKAYAGLEHQLATLFMHLIGAKAEIAWAIFFRISNTRTRYAMIGDLLKIRHRTKFKKSWDQLERWLTPLDTKRNHLIHWYIEEEAALRVEGGWLKAVGDKIAVTRRHRLRNPVSRFTQNENSLSYTIPDLRQFREDVERMGHIILLFGTCFQSQPVQPLLEIFQQPITHRSQEAFLQHLIDAI